MDRNPSSVAPEHVEVALQDSEKPREKSLAETTNEHTQKSEEEEKKGALTVFVCSQEFEIACGCAIFYSVVVICLQTDAVDAPFFIQFSESSVTAFFLFEWCLRVIAFGWKWFKEFGPWLDTFIVWCPGVIVVWVMQPMQVDPSMSDPFKFFRIARMLRFVQLVKTFKHVSYFEDLWKLVRGLVSSGGTLFAAMSLIVFNLYVFAIFCCELIGFQQFSSEASDDAKDAQERFKGISSSMLTLTRFMHGDDSQAIMDALVEELPYIWIFLWLFTALSSFVLLNLVTAVIVQQAMDMSKGDEQEMALVRKREQEREMKELEEMFRDIDEDGSGIVSLAEFEEAFKDSAICDKFLMLGLKKEQAMELFALLDTGGEGELDLDEFMQGMSQLKGVAKNKDLVMLVKGIERLGKGITRMGHSMGVSGLQDDAQDSPEKLKDRVVNLRNKLRERLQKTEDGLQRFSARMDKMAAQAEVAIKRIKSGGAPPSRKDDFARSKTKSRDHLAIEKKAKSEDRKERAKDKEGKEGRDREAKEGKEREAAAKEGRERESKEGREREGKEGREKETKEGREPDTKEGREQKESKERKEPREKREKKEHKERRKKKPDDVEDAEEVAESG